MPGILRYQLKIEDSDDPWQVALLRSMVGLSNNLLFNLVHETYYFEILTAELLWQRTKMYTWLFEETAVSILYPTRLRWGLLCTEMPGTHRWNSDSVASNEMKRNNGGTSELFAIKLRSLGLGTRWRSYFQVTSTALGVVMNSKKLELSRSVVECGCTVSFSWCRAAPRPNHITGF